MSKEPRENKTKGESGGSGDADEADVHDEERRRGYRFLDCELRIASCDALGAAAGGGD